MLRPLVDRYITRQGCIEIIQAEGLDMPQKSGCWICPFQPKSQWHELYRRHPDLFERAARLEELSSERRGVQAHIRAGGTFTIRELEATFSQQLSLLDDPDWDDLLAYKPCHCTL